MNVDTTTQLQNRVRSTLISGIKRDWSDAWEAATEAGRQTIIGVNKLRACGEKLKQLSGHEQINLIFFKTIEDQLPKSLRYREARMAVLVANKLDRDVKTIQEARVAQRELFATMMDYREPRRLSEQSAHETNPWSDFVSEAARFTALFDCLDDSPMTKWSREKLKKFADVTRPVVDKYNEAVQLLK